MFAHALPNNVGCCLIKPPAPYMLIRYKFCVQRWGFYRATINIIYIYSVSTLQVLAPRAGTVHERLQEDRRQQLDTLFLGPGQHLANRSIALGMDLVPGTVCVVFPVLLGWVCSYLYIYILCGFPISLIQGWPRVCLLADPL